MKNLGELMLFIESLDFEDKKDLEQQLIEMLRNTEDKYARNSLETAISTLKTLSEEELKSIKENL